MVLKAGAEQRDPAEEGEEKATFVNSKHAQRNVMNGAAEGLLDTGI